MKTNKLLAAGALALSMAMTPVASLINAMPIAAATVTVPANHTYEAYKVFKGTASGKSLTNIDWADNITEENAQAILTAINDSTDNNLISLKNANSAADLAKKLESAQNDDATVRALAKLLNKNVDKLGNPLTINEQTNLDAGYYLFRDKTQTLPENDVYGLSVLKVANSNIKVEPKNAAPTVDKEVYDNDQHDEIAAGSKGSGTQSSTAGFGESADHEIGETFQFKITANGLTYYNIKDYDTYKLQFHDTWSEGVDYQGNVKVYVHIAGRNQDREITDKAFVDHVENTRTMTVTINDLLTVLNDEEKEANNFTVYAVYDAKLNEKAIAESNIFDDSNDVYLTYSNNPNGTGEGKTEHDKVYVGSFKITNKKVDTDDNGLSGAQFVLKKDNQFATLTTAEDGSYVLSGWGEEAKATTITTPNSGEFIIKGLDSGTYMLVETKAPDNYSLPANPNTTITITATHNESATLDQAEVTITGTNETGAEIVNSRISTLPETGGMGTTMIYSAGALLAVGAAVVYVTNKRTRKN